MKKTHSFLLVLILLFSCSKTPSEEIYQGKLEELIVGDLIIKKDSLTKGIEVKQSINNQDVDYIISLADRERTIQYYSVQTGKKVKEVKLPFDGPDSFKGYIGSLIAEGMDSLTLINSDGWFYKYFQGQRTILERINPQLEFPNTYNSSIFYGRRTNFTNVSESLYQISVSPLIRPSSNYFGKTKAFDKIEEWIILYNSKENKTETHTILFPYNYRSNFLDDHLSYPPIVEFLDNKNYVLFPYSDSIFVISEFNLIEKNILRSGIKFNFSGSEKVVRGEYGYVELKKDASSHLDFMYDKYRNIFIRISKIKESGVGETTRERSKYYILSFYDSNLNPLSEYTFEYNPGTKLENYFIASDGFYLNKPEQKSEDEYEFNKIDLSRIRN